MERAWHPRLTAAPLLLTMTLSACGPTTPTTDGSFNPSGTNAPDAAPTTSAAPAHALTKAEADKAVLARYREYQKTYEKVYATGDPTPLADIAMDPLLTIITKDVQATYKDRKGVIWRFRNLLNPKIRSRSKDLTSIVVIDCVRTLGAYQFSAETGKRISGTDKSSTYVYQARFQYDGTTWKVAEARKGKRC